MTISALPWQRSWDISEDGLNYVFHLRQGVKFHNGAEFTSADVVYSFDKLREYLPSYFETIDSYYATDDYTFCVDMKNPYPAFLPSLSDGYWFIVNKEACETYGYESNEACIGTGPYALEYNGADKIVLKAFPDYWDPEHVAIVETINFPVITDSNTAFMSAAGRQSWTL